MVRIRLRRVGAKRQPSYRVVVADAESPRDGRFIEMIGHYNPRTDPPTFDIKEDRALYWLGVGAQPSDPVRRLLEKRGLLQRLAEMPKGGAAEAQPPAAVEPPQATEAEAPEPLEAQEETVAEEAAEEAAADEAMIPTPKEVSP